MTLKSPINKVANMEVNISYFCISSLYFLSTLCVICYAMKYFIMCNWKGLLQIICRLHLTIRLGLEYIRESGSDHEWCPCNAVLAKWISTLEVRGSSLVQH